MAMMKPKMGKAMGGAMPAKNMGAKPKMPKMGPTKPSMNMGKKMPKPTSGGAKGTLGGGAGGY